MRRMLVLAALAVVGGAAPVGATTVPAESADGRISVEVLEVGERIDSLSPDGQWLAGVGPEGQPCIWAIDTLDPFCATDPELRVGWTQLYPSMRWAPDSSAVAFTDDFFRNLREPDIIVLSTDGDVTNLTDDGTDDGWSPVGDDAVPADVDVGPTWSLDSGSVYFARTVSGGDRTLATTEIMAVPAAGGEAQLVAEVPVPGPYVVWLPMWFSDDGTLWFTVSAPDPDAEGNGIWRVAPGGAAELVRADDPVTDEPGNLFSPAISGVTPGGDELRVANYLAISRYAGAPQDAELFWTVDAATGEATVASFLSIGKDDQAVLIDAASGRDAVDDFETDSPILWPGGAQAYSPDGSQWVGLYRSADPADSRFVLVDAASDGIIASWSSVDAEPSALTAGAASDELVVSPAQPQFATNGTVLVQGIGGTALLFTIEE